MSLIIDAIIIIALFALFGWSHTLMASREFKQKIVENAGKKIAFYRLFYNVSSIIIFVAIYALSPKPGVIIFDLPYPWDIVIFVLQALSLVGLLESAFYFDLGEFLGISQIKRYYRGTYDETELDEHSELNIRGPFRLVRHPVYFFSILFLGLRPVMSFFYLIFFLCITAYFVIGSVYEERKLIKQFGVKYQRYREQVPRLFPYKFYKKDTNTDI